MVMSNEEKLKHFEQTVLGSAERMRDGINSELDRQTAEALDECRNAYKREASKMRHKGIEEARKEARLIVSTAQNKGQTALMSKRSEIIDEVFDALTDRLRAFTVTEPYDKYFTKRLVDALNAATVHLGESNARIVIEVSDGDFKKMAGLINETAEAIVVWAQTDVIVSEDDIIGGCVVRVPSLGLVIDNSMKADAVREREDFLSWSGLSLH